MAERQRGAASSGVEPRLLRARLPVVSLIVILVRHLLRAAASSASYFGLDLLLRLAVPLALATLAQLFIMTVNDLDLSIGAYIGLTAGISATLLVDAARPGRARPGRAASPATAPSVRSSTSAGCPRSSSRWACRSSGSAWPSRLLPTPGGEAPEWLRALMTLKPELIPFPIIALVVIAARRPRRR